MQNLAPGRFSVLQVEQITGWRPQVTLPAGVADSASIRCRVDDEQAGSGSPAGASTGASSGSGSAGDLATGPRVEGVVDREFELKLTKIVNLEKGEAIGDGLEAR